MRLKQEIIVSLRPNNEQTNPKRLIDTYFLLMYSKTYILII